jgi:hypothetical protein
MTVRDMHIEINQSLQKVAANLTRKYLSEEIDWVLNKIQNRFIQQCIRPVDMSKPELQKFRFADQLRAEALRTITITGRQLEVWTDGEGNSMGRVGAFLPSDYLYLLSDVSTMTNLCGTTKIDGTEVKYYRTLHVLPTTKVSAPYYQTGTVTLNNLTASIPSTLSPFAQYTGYQGKEDVLFLKDYIMHSFNRAGLRVYWEHYGSLYKANQFIVPCTAASITALMIWDGVDVTDATLDSFSVIKHSASPNVANAQVTTDNRLTTSYDVSSMFTPYYKPSIKSPISELANHILYVYHDDNTIVNSVTVSYIRKPSPISLSLGLNCEISESFHQTICDLAVEYIKGQQEDGQGVTVKKQDNDTRVIL